MVERHVANVNVASSNLVSRSKTSATYIFCRWLFSFSYKFRTNHVPNLTLIMFSSEVNDTISPLPAIDDGDR